MNMAPAARLCLILCAALAALALYLSGGAAGWISFTLVVGGLALLSIDRLRWIKPLPSQLGFVPILGAAGFGLWEWLAGGGDARAAADACVHFILLCQIAAVFSDLSGPQIGMSLAGSVILLLVSVKHQPHPGHLPILLLLLLTATATMIFRVALGRQHEFHAMTVRTQRQADTALVPADRRFAWRMGYVTLVLALLATALGLSGFFFFPRVSLAAQTPSRGHGGGDSPLPRFDPEGNPIKDITLNDEDDPAGPGGGGGAGKAGWEDQVSLKNFGKILDAPGMALHINREKIDASKPLPASMLYLRGHTATVYSGGIWRNDPMPAPQVLTAVEDGRWLLIDWEKDANQVLGTGVFEFVTVQDKNPDPRHPLFVPEAADRLDNRPSPGAVWRHGDSALRLAGRAPGTYRFLCQVTPQPLQPNDPTPCAHPYAEMTGITITRREGLLELAGRAAGGASTDQGKAQAIAQFLRASGEYSYTLDLPKMPATGYNDPVEYFLLGSKRGHCAFFATAFVILARLNHLPARLATGFAVPVTATQTEIDVPNINAHAWAEIYLADKGWVTVDATPRGNNGLPLPTPAETPGNTDPKHPTDPTQPDLTAAGGDSPATPIDNPILTYNSEHQNRLYALLRAILQAPLLPLPGLTIRLWHFLALLTIVAVAVLVRRRLTGDEFLETIDGVAVRGIRPRIAFYRRMLAIMKSRGRSRRPSQSATEYAQMLVAREDAAARSVLALTDLYLLLRFGLLDEPRRKAVWAEHRTEVKRHLRNLEVLLAAEKTIAAEREN